MHLINQVVFSACPVIQSWNMFRDKKISQLYLYIYICHKVVENSLANNYMDYKLIIIEVSKY